MKHSPALTDVACLKGRSDTMSDRIALSVEGLALQVGDRQLLRDMSFDLHHGDVLSAIGPAGCGTSLLLRSLVGLVDVGRRQKLSGRVRFRERGGELKLIRDPAQRRQVALVSQAPNPFAGSVWDNIVYGLRLHQMASHKSQYHDIVEFNLRRVHLWDEVKDQLRRGSARDLSLSQQRKLCLARALALEPPVLLIDKPVAGAEGIRSSEMFQIIDTLRADYAILMVAQSLENAAAIADRVAYFEAGELVELDTAEMIFTNAREQRTREFLDVASAS